MNDRDYRTVLRMVARCEKIDAILERFERSYELFGTEVSFQDSCCMNLIQIGELVGRLSDELKERRSEVPWVKIRAARNLFAHDYDSVDAESVWETVTRDVPALRGVLLEILAEKDLNAG